MTAKPKQSVKPVIIRQRRVKKPSARCCNCMKKRKTKVHPTSQESVVLQFISLEPNIRDITSDVKNSTGATASNDELYQKGCKIPAVAVRESRKYTIVKSLPKLLEQVPENNVTVDSYVDSQVKIKILHPLSDRDKSLRLPASRRREGRITPNFVDKKMKLLDSGDPCPDSDSTQLRKTVTATGRDISYMDAALPKRRLKMSPKYCSFSPAPAKRTGQGDKRIRNQICKDHCGQCRYCRDETKVGGQNHLQHKCLHRRCKKDNGRNSGQSQQYQISPALGEPTKSSGLKLSDSKSNTTAKGIIKSESELLKFVKASTALHSASPKLMKLSSQKALMPKEKQMKPNSTQVSV